MATRARKSGARRRVYDTLSTEDLPALIDRGLLEYDDGVIVATAELEELVEQRAATDDGRWFRRFAAASVLLACLMLAAAAGLLPAEAPVFGALTLLGALALVVLPVTKYLTVSASSQEK